MKLKKKAKKKYVCYSSKLGKFHLKRYILSLRGKNKFQWYTILKMKCLKFGIMKILKILTEKWKSKQWVKLYQIIKIRRKVTMQF